MEESLKNIFGQTLVEANKLKTYSPLALAYVGDAVYDLIIRTKVVSEKNCKPNKYHQETIQYVNANAQMKHYMKIQNLLTEEEQAVFRRGKNTKTPSPAKNQSIHDYRIATGVEALIGYLYLSGQMERILELMEYGLREEE